MWRPPADVYRRARKGAAITFSFGKRPSNASRRERIIVRIIRPGRRGTWTPPHFVVLPVIGVVVGVAAVVEQRMTTAALQPYPAVANSPASADSNNTLSIHRCLSWGKFQGAVATHL